MLSHSQPQDTVLFDGHCNFCRSQIAILRRLDGRGRLHFVSLHEPEVAQLYPDLSMQELMEQMWIVSSKGKRYGGAYAVRYLTTRLPILWLAAPVMHFPGSMILWNFLYRTIATMRYRIAGRNCDPSGTCALHFTDKSSRIKST
jgi:predicted DCC family thiol-disulfide oxidoreductase YuxK